MSTRPKMSELDGANGRSKQEKRIGFWLFLCLCVSVVKKDSALQGPKCFPQLRESVNDNLNRLSKKLFENLIKH